MHALHAGPDAPPALPSTTRVAIVGSSYYRDLLSQMEEAAREVLCSAGIAALNIRSLSVPGAFEIPLACKWLTESGAIDGIVALGVIVQGESHHAAEIARACTEGLMRVQLEAGIPIAHEVLFVDTFKLAKERCSGRGNKGAEAARSLAAMLALFPPLLPG